MLKLKRINKKILVLATTLFPFGQINAEKLIIALGNFEPMFAEKNQPALFKDLIDGVYRYVPDKSISYRYMLSNERLRKALNDKTVDAAVNIFSAKEVKGCLTDPVFAYSDVAITKKSSELTINHIDDLKKLSVVSYQSATELLGDEFKSAVNGNVLYKEVAHPDAQAKLLATNMVDVSVGDKYIFFHSLQTWSNYTFDANGFDIHYIFPPVASSLGFNKESHCQEFNQALTTFKQSGEYEAVYQKHLKRLGYTL